jgi:hypothetical protein
MSGRGAVHAGSGLRAADRKRLVPPWSAAAWLANPTPETVFLTTPRRALTRA